MWEKHTETCNNYFMHNDDHGSDDNDDIMVNIS